MAMTWALQTQGLTRVYPAGGGVRNLDLAVPTQSLYGFVGPNGAGKSTTLRLLLGLLRPQAGTVHIVGQPVHAGTRAAVGGLIETPSVYAHLSGRDNLEVTRRLLGAPKASVDIVLERVGLRAAAHQRVRGYSLGMRQRLGLALALLSQPQVLILDEPTNGLDPQGIVELRQMLRQWVREDGMTVLMSSHLLSEVEHLATHIGVLVAGQLRFQGRMADLQALARARIVVQCDPLAGAYDLLTQRGVAARLEGTSLVLDTDVATAEINRWLVTAGVAVHALGTERPTLESLFFDLTRPAVDRLSPQDARVAADRSLI